MIVKTDYETNGSFYSTNFYTLAWPVCDCSGRSTAPGLEPDWLELPAGGETELAGGGAAHHPATPRLELVTVGLK